MKIVRRISDNVVLYLVPDSDPAVINDRGLHTRTTRALDIGPDTHEVVEGVAAPELFVGGTMAWDDGWTVTDQTAYDAARFQLIIPNNLYYRYNGVATGLWWELR